MPPKKIEKAQKQQGASAKVAVDKVGGCPLVDELG